MLASLALAGGARASQLALTPTTITNTQDGQVIGAEFDLREMDEVLAATLSIEIEAAEEPSSTSLPVARLVITGGTGSLPSSTELGSQTATGVHAVYLKSGQGAKLVGVSWLFLGDRSTTSRVWIALANKPEDIFEDVRFVEASISVHLQEATGISHAVAAQAWSKSPTPAVGSEDQAETTAELAGARLRVSPNPLRSTATVFLRAPESGTVSLEIFDVSGRRVFLTRLPVAGGGHQELIWPGTDMAGRAVASGVYYVRAHGAGIDLSKKVVLIR